jgi:hypothetical protein
MPKCIDDPSRSYTGKEPSPKGLGYCAHTHSVGTTKTGNDGNTWTVETTYKGTKRWVKKSGTRSTSGKRRSTKRSSKKTSGKRRSTKRTSKKKTSGKRRNTKRSSRKRRSTKRTSKKKTSGKPKSSSCGKIIYEKGRSAGLKSGREYDFAVYSVDAKGAMDWKHKKKFKMVYNPSAFKEKMEKLLCTWSKGKKLRLFSVAYNNRRNEASVHAGWK